MRVFYLKIIIIFIDTMFDYIVTFLFKNRISVYKPKPNTMEIKDYKSGDKVEILINNPRNNNVNEWRDAEVLDKRTIYPTYGSHHPPYPILIVRVIRTYCNATPKYRWIDGNIPVYDGSDIEFYDKENDEGIIYSNQIRLKQ